ncbi:hypothetical protein LguiB_010487 [Lonicera macranthoides]
MDALGSYSLSKMASNVTDDMSIEINVKTMDPRTYTLRVNKHLPVPQLKAQIATVTCVPSEHQRLIYCGRAMSDDHLLSAYNVDDGHTLHLVDIQRVQRTPALSVNTPAANAYIHPAPIYIFSTSNGQGTEEVPGVLVEVFYFTFDGHVHPHVRQLLSAMRGAFDNNYNGGGNERIHVPDLVNSLTTMFQYLRNMRRDYGVVGTSNSPIQDRVPTPEVLAEILLSTRDLLINQISESILHLGRTLENQSNINSLRQRLRAQSNARRDGALIQNLGTFLLELGRATSTLHLGNEPDEAIVNAGSPVFISQSGPNPLRVQGPTFQLTTSFGPTSMRPSRSGSAHHPSADPSRIGIQVQRDSWEPHVYHEPYGGLYWPMNSAGEAHIGQAPINNMFFTIASSDRLPGQQQRGPRTEGHASGSSYSPNAADEQGNTIVAAQELQASASDQAIFLSNLLHEIMPVVMEKMGSLSYAVSSERPNDH